MHNISKYYEVVAGIRALLSFRMWIRTSTSFANDVSEDPERPIALESRIDIDDF